MIREVVEDAACTVHTVAASNALAVKEHILRLKRAAEIRFGHNARRHVPVQRPGAPVRFLNPVAVGIVCIRVPAGPGDAVLGIVGVVLAAGVVGHVAGGIVLVVGSVGGVHAVPGIGGRCHVLGVALGYRLREQVAPGVISV